MNVQTHRSLLVPATALLVSLEIDGPDALGRELHAEVPANWPPEQVRDALPWFLKQLTATPALAGWLGWYGLLTRPDGLPLLVGSVGFFGPPEEGAVEVGYSVLPPFEGRGYATEMVAGLVTWALAQSEVRRVVAEVDAVNVASRRVLEKAGFEPIGPGRETGHLRYERVQVSSAELGGG